MVDDPAVRGGETTDPRLDRGAEVAFTRERRLLAAIYAHDRATMRELMTPDGIGVDGSFGHARQHELIEQINQLDGVAGEAKDFTFRALGDDGALVAYRLAQQGREKGRPLPPLVACITLWSRRDGMWMAVLHQETPVLP